MNITEVFDKLFDKSRKYYVPYSNNFANGGTVIGMYKHRGYENIVFVGGDMHTLCIGATRSGKSRTVVLESIGLQALTGENIICSDPKGELYQYTYAGTEEQWSDVDIGTGNEDLTSAAFEYKTITSEGYCK